MDTPPLADWMLGGDPRFLAFFCEREGEIYGPTAVARNTRKTTGEPYNSDYVGHRLRALTDAGLLDKPAFGQYTISELGVRYCEGAVGPSDVPEPD